MTNEQINIAIAEACGWTDCEYVKSLGLCKGRNSHLVPQYETGHSIIPNYCNDLNAMHEAEEWLMNNDPHAYGCYVSDIYDKQSNCIHLAARIKAEEFLWTLGKWEDEA
jgi:hypothetical protein